MKLIVKEHINAITELDPHNAYGMIPMNIGLMKGDLIVFYGEGDPRRFPSGTAFGKVMRTNPESPSGWELADQDASAVQLINRAGQFVPAGSPVHLWIDSYSGDGQFDLAVVNSSTPVFITGEDSMPGDAVTCYAAHGTIVPVLCKGAFIRRGGVVAVTEKGYCGLASSASKVVIGIATKYKAADSEELVPVLLTGTGMSPVPYSDDDEHVSIIKTFSADTLTPESGYVYRSSKAAGHGSLTVTLPASPAEDFIFEINFNSTAAFTGVNFRRNGAGYDVKLAGDKLTNKSKRYNLIVWWDGLYFWCCSKGL